MAIGDLVQASSVFASSTSFGAAPAAGNLLIAFATERSGTTGFSISGGGTWTPLANVEHKPGDATYRHTMTVWWKIALGTETGTISVAAGDYLSLIEMDAGGETLVEVGTGSIANDFVDNGSANVADITPATGSLAAGTKVMLAGNVTKEDGYTPWGTWSVGPDNWHNFDSGATQRMDHAFTAFLSSAAGVQSSTASGANTIERTVSAFIIALSYGAGGLTASVNDGSTATDAVTTALDHVRVEADAGTASDAVTPALDHVRVEADAGVASDAVTTALGQVVDLNDAGVASDAVTVAMDHVRVVADGSTATDNAVPVVEGDGEIARTVNDAGVASDAVTVSMDHVRVEADAGVALDAVTVALDHVRSVADGSTATDNAVPVLGDPFNRQISDTGTATDAVIVQLVLGVKVTGSIDDDAPSIGAVAPDTSLVGVLTDDC